MAEPSEKYLPIEDYGIIGDLYTAALVSMHGSIDFLCFPHFDSPSVFAALLDHEKGGRFEITPLLDDSRRRQLYLPDSNILLTRTLSPQGVAEISDFMPVEPAGLAHNLVRRVKTVRGEMRYRMRCQPRFDYARASHKIEVHENRVVFVSEGPDRTALALIGSVPMQVVNGDVHAEFTLAAGESAEFVLERAEECEESPCWGEHYVAESFKDTLNYWRRWIGRSTYRGRWREFVNRSALTLKLLVSRQYGSMVAAPTFGLPELIGGGRNWDYRFTWIRDSAFILYALTRLGYTSEAGDFMRWLAQRCDELQSGGRSGRCSRTSSPRSSSRTCARSCSRTRTSSPGTSRSCAASPWTTPSAARRRRRCSSRTTRAGAGRARWARSSRAATATPGATRRASSWRPIRLRCARRSAASSRP